jgi:hypothetical protein
VNAKLDLYVIIKLFLTKTMMLLVLWWVLFHYVLTIANVA